MADAIEIERHLTIDGTEYDVLQFETREALDEIGMIRCEISDRAGGPDPATLLDKPLVLQLSRVNGDQARTLAGYVVEAESTTTRGNHETGTTVTARPRLFRLTQRADCRVFQDVTAPDIVKQVLTLAGLPADAQAWKTTGTYPKRVYTAQYRETDFDFIERLLSEEGIAFAVDCSSGKDVVTFFDTDLGDVEGAKAVRTARATG